MLSLRPIRVPLSLIALFLIPETAQAQTPAAPGPSPWPYEDISVSDLTPSRPSDVAPRARAPLGPFGAQGQLVLGGGTTIGVSSTKFDNSAASQLST